MKNLFPLLALLLTLVSGCKKSSLPASPSFLLQGEIEQTHDSSLVAIIQTSINTFAFDTVRIQNNRFELRHATDSVVKINLLTGMKSYSVYLNGNDTLQLKIAGDSLQVIGKPIPFALWSIKQYIAAPSDSINRYPTIIRNEIESYRTTQQKTAIGRVVPYMLLRDSEGKNVSTLESSKTYRLITFWATWDSLSVKRVKELVPLAKKFEKKAITFINISFDTNDSLWRKEIKALNLPGHNIRSREGFASENMQKLDVQTLPQNLILDMQSMVISKNIFGSELGDFLTKEVTAPKQKEVKR